MRLLYLLFLLSATLCAQDASPYRLTLSNGLAGVAGSESLNQGLLTTVHLDRVRALGDKTTVLLGAGLQHANYENGREGVPCDFPLGDKVVVFDFSETYESNALSAVFRMGAEQRFGKFSLRGILLPTLRLRDRITANSNISFTGGNRPDQFVSSKIRPNETFGWTDGSARQLRYNSAVQLQAALETDIAIGKRLALGIGLQAGLTKYTIDNVYIAQTLFFPGNPPTENEFVTSTADARTVSGYLNLRINL